MALGNIDRASESTRGLYEICSDVGPNYELAGCFGLRARIELRRDDLESAREHCLDGLKVARGLGDKLTTSELVMVAGLLAHAERQVHESVTLHGGAARLRDRIGLVLARPGARQLEGELRELRSTLGQAAYDTAWQHGQQLSQEQLAALATETLSPDTTG